MSRHPPPRKILDPSLNTIQLLFRKQECIPVGCVPGGYLVWGCVYLVWGVYLVPGRCVPGLRGCTWSRGVYLVRGVSARYTPLDPTRYTPRTRPGTPPPGTDQVHPPRTRPGTPPEQTRYHPSPREQTRYPPGNKPGTPPPVDRITDACKNIALAQLRCGR